MKRFLIPLVCSVALTLTVTARADDASALKAHLMETTKIVAVIGDAVNGFVPDNDPNTLEVVFTGTDGASRVSDDGEVIFLSANATDQAQQDLIGKAFDIRVQRQMHGGNMN